MTLDNERLTRERLVDKYGIADATGVEIADAVKRAEGSRRVTGYGSVHVMAATRIARTRSEKQGRADNDNGRTP